MSATISLSDLSQDPPRVLVVADDGLTLARMVQTLREDGYEAVGLAGTPSTVLAFVQKEADVLDAAPLGTEARAPAAARIAEASQAQAVPVLVLSGLPMLAHAETQRETRSDEMSGKAMTLLGALARLLKPAAEGASARSQDRMPMITRRRTEVDQEANA